MVEKIKIMNLLSVFLMLFMSCSNKDTVVDKEKLLGNDYRLFQETPVWDLAKAVWDEDVDRIKQIVKRDSIDIDFQESKFGNTLLMLTVSNQQSESCKALLELGADPNKHDTYRGSSAMIDAAEVNGVVGDNTEFLKLMLLYGGNPNDVEIGEREEGNTTRYTPLLRACANVNELVSPIGKVKLLVEEGGYVKYNGAALGTSIMMEYYDVVLYLLNNGANYQEVIIDRSKFSKDGKKMYIADMLKENLHPLDSKEYKQKMEIVVFLKEKGIDYRALPIPDYVKKEAKATYGKGWKEYLEKY
jgi:hypothetical protein